MAAQRQYAILENSANDAPQVWHNPADQGRLDLEHHGGKTPADVMARVLQRILALTAAIWHNDHTCQPFKRSLWPMATDLESIIGAATWCVDVKSCGWQTGAGRRP